MYGQTGGRPRPALATLRRSYPMALAYVEDAARAGEAGGLVRSWLGRTCPPPSQLDDGTVERPDPATASRPASPTDRRGSAAPARRARARGRFTRNFVIQATAAEWALALLATLRTALAGTPGPDRVLPA